MPRKSKPQDSADTTALAGQSNQPADLETTPERWREAMKQIDPNATLWPAKSVESKFLRPPDYDPDRPESMFWDFDRKFTRKRKLAYLRLLLQHGRPKLAASGVGVSRKTIQAARDKDPLFAEMADEAEETYHERAAATLEHYALHGTADIRWDRDGNIQSYRRVFNNQLQAMVLKRADERYVDRQKQEIEVKGGALMVPTPLDNPLSWDATVAAVQAGLANSVNSGAPGISENSGARPALISESAGGGSEPLAANGEPSDDDPLESLTARSQAIDTDGSSE